MNRNLRFLITAIAILLCLACLFPTVISLDKDQQEEASPTFTAEPTPEPPPTDGDKDCGSDLVCFYTALDSCQESSLAYSQSINMMGAEVSTTLNFSVLGPLEDLCQFSVLTDQVTISISEEAVQQLLASGKTEEEIEAQRLAMEESQAAAGFDEVCTGNPKDLIQVLQRWESGQFAMTDWDPFTCEGKLFSTSETPPEPTVEPPPTAEPAPTTGGNFLANMSFEDNPETTQPLWYVDTKNTNVVAKWTSEESKLGQYSLLLSATDSANQGFPGWFMVDPIPVEEQVWHVFQVWAMSPDGADAFVSAQFLDQSGVFTTGQSSGCVDLEPNIWKNVGFGISEPRLEDVSAIRLGLQQCTLETEGTLTHLYYDEIYFGTTPP